MDTEMKTYQLEGQLLPAREYLVTQVDDEVKLPEITVTTTIIAETLEKARRIAKHIFEEGNVSDLIRDSSWKVKIVEHEDE